MRKIAKTNLIVVQATSFCNINCNYCYLADRETKRHISLESVSDIVDWMLSSGNLAENVTIAWHAGEPLVMSGDFFSRAFEIFERLALGNTRVHHSIQTNGMLVSDEHCKIFRSIRCNVGVSLDGDKPMHDANRIDRQGRGTYDRTVAGIKRLIDNGVSISAIAVVGPQSFGKADSFYSTYRSLGIPLVGINLQEIEGINTYSYIRGVEFDAAYASFLRRIFELSCMDGVVGIRELIHALRVVLDGDELHSTEANLGEIMSFTSHGYVATFSPELLGASINGVGKFEFGPLRNLPFDKFISHPHLMMVDDEVIRGIDKCRATCEQFSVCGGGAPSNKYGECSRFDVAETRSCVLAKKLCYEVIFDLFQERPELIDLARETWWGRAYLAPATGGRF